MTSVRCAASGMTTAPSNLTAGYLLHRRPFRDNSYIGDFLLLSAGRVSVLVRTGSRGDALRRAQIQPFQPLQLSYAGSGEIKTARQLETVGAAVHLLGPRLYAGLYLNEVLVRALVAGDAVPEIFTLYESTLVALEREPLEPVLRRFEWCLLAASGYGVDFTLDVAGNPIEASADYGYIVGEGFVLLSPGLASNPTQNPLDSSESPGVAKFAGVDIVALAQEEWDRPDIMRQAKRLSRLALVPLVGDKPLQSRSLFRRH